MTQFLDDNNVVQATIGNIYNVSDFKIGDFYFATILDYLPGFGTDNMWGIIKFAMLVLTFILAVLFIIVVRKINGLTAKNANLAKEISPPESAKSGSNARWDEIQKHINSTREGEWKFAVIEADKLTDEALKSGGFVGETMGERLMNIEPGQLTTLQELWEAHKIRNRLVHDTNYFLRYAEAKKAVSLYEKS